MPTCRSFREGQCGLGRTRRGCAPIQQPSSTRPIHRGSEHGMQEKVIWAMEGSPEPVGQPNIAVRAVAGLGLGGGHSSDEAG
jgi:hypothetical protein